MPELKRLAPDDARDNASWDAFVMAHPDATFFHRAGWQRVLRSSFGHDTHFLYTLSGGRISGVLPLAHVRSILFGSALTSLPFAVYGGIVADDADSAALLAGEAQALARRLGVAHLELRNRTRQQPEWPEQDLYVTFRKAILDGAEANMLAIPRKQRAMVRKGIKNGLTSTGSRAGGDGIDRFFALYADNVHRHGTPAMPKAYFKALQREFGRDCRVLTVSAADGTPVSSVMSFYFRDEVLPYYAGDAAAARDLAGNDFKYWELLRQSCDEGLKTFDYGRSKRDTGSFAFKSNWGFEPAPLHYEYCLYKRDAVPQNNPANAKYKLLIETWRRLPIGVANWLGPFVVRSLG